MYHFFVEPENIRDEYIKVLGDDINHIKNVLRMKIGEKVLIGDGTGKEYTCAISEISDEEILLIIEDFNNEGRELPVDIYLFQGLPKSDKMELIIQKAVELGAKNIIPVATKRCVVKIDKKKEESKIKRWQAISESAAKQSKRGIIPEIYGCMTFKEAVDFCKDFDIMIIPYENCESMAATKEAINKIKPNQKVAIFIGPEGGFCESEIEYAIENKVIPVSLGKRILRTETAGLMILSVIMYKIEEQMSK
jgi:16S rRNA (uracil1498-N3)-methyltransferase